MPSSSEALRRAALAIVLQEIMDRLGLTQEALGVRCGRDKTYVNKLMKGRLGFGFDDMEVLAKAAEMTELEFYAHFWAVRDREARKR